MDFKDWFRGSVLEELLIPYTLPGFPLVLLMAILLPPDTVWQLFTNGNIANPPIALILGWGLSIVASGTESALGRVLEGCLPAVAKRWLASVSKDRHDRTIEAMGLSDAGDKHKRYELVRSRLYLWGEFNKGMVFTVPLIALFLPVVAERYFSWIALPVVGIVLVYLILVLVTFAHLRNWQRDLWRWELFEGVRSGEEEARQLTRSKL